DLFEPAAPIILEHDGARARGEVASELLPLVAEALGAVAREARAGRDRRADLSDLPPRLGLEPNRELAIALRQRGRTHDDPGALGVHREGGRRSLTGNERERHAPFARAVGKAK